MAIVEASAKAHMAFNEQEVLKQLKSNMMHNIYNIDRGVAERFALMLAELNKSITGERFQTLDIIDAATAVENGLSFCTFHDKPMDHLQKTFGLNLSLPSRTMAISA